MRRRAKFQLQGRNEDGVWTTVVKSTYLQAVWNQLARYLNARQALPNVSVQDAPHVFTRMRLRYRGLTLAKWQGGSW